MGCTCHLAKHLTTCLLNWHSSFSSRECSHKCDSSPSFLSRSTIQAISCALYGPLGSCLTHSRYALHPLRLEYLSSDVLTLNICSQLVKWIPSGLVTSPVVVRQCTALFEHRHVV